MSRVRTAETAAEVELRRALRRAGLSGWRSQARELPGRPDFVFVRERLAVFVDGAFWHGHPSKFRFGRSGEFWDTKIAMNMARDRRDSRQLNRAGWSVLRLWDFRIIGDPARAAERIQKRLRRGEAASLLSTPVSSRPMRARRRARG